MGLVIRSRSWSSSLGTDLDSNDWINWMDWVFQLEWSLFWIEWDEMRTTVMDYGLWNKSRESGLPTINNASYDVSV